MATLEDGASLGDQIQTRPPNWAEMKSSGTNDSAGPDMRSSGADDPAVDDPKIGKPDADTAGTFNWHIL